MPSIEDGMLVFNDNLHYERYIEYIDSLSSNLTEEQELLYSETDLDPQEIILDSIESSIGFISLRKLNYENLIAENEIGWDDIMNIPDYSDFGSNSEQSTLNSKKEVKIGNNVRKLISNKYEIIINNEIDVISTHILSEVRILERNYPNGDIPLEYLRNLDYSMNYLKIFDLERGELLFDSIGSSVPLNEYAISGNLFYGDPCFGQFNQITLNGFTLVQVSSWFQGYPGGSAHVAWYDIDFGNGDFVNNIQGNGGQFGVTFNQMYIYPNSGNYNITINAKLSANGPIVATKTYNIEITSNSSACNNKKKSNFFYWNYTTDYKASLNLKFYKLIHLPNMSTNKHVKAYLKNYKKKNNKWKIEKTDRMSIHVESKAYDEKCEPHDDPFFVNNSGYWTLTSVFKDNTNSLKIFNSSMTKKLYYNTIEASISIKNNNIIYTKNYTLSACN
ncbi:MAG TPA: hypothetical protein VLZ83_16875 [Edaphocola sp.]|nr:hypothetical protein [Edaphocola sp.]